MKAVGVWFRSSATGRYLYLLRNDTRHPGTWGLPGGKVESGETLLGAMERECIEELGAMPDYQRLVPLEKFTSSDDFNYIRNIHNIIGENGSVGNFILGNLYIAIKRINDYKKELICNKI